MKLSIPANTWLTDASVDYAKEGYHNGQYMVFLTFSGGSCSGDELVATVLSAVSQTTLPKKLKIVRLRGMFDPKDDAILLLIYSLKSYGFSVQAVVPNGFVAPWMEKVDWLIVKTEKPNVLITSNEVWYMPPESSKLVEPTLPKVFGHLYVIRGRAVADTTKFITEAQNTWKLL